MDMPNEISRITVGLTPWGVWQAMFHHQGIEVIHVALLALLAACLEGNEGRLGGKGGVVPLSSKTAREPHHSCNNPKDDARDACDSHNESICTHLEDRLLEVCT